MDKTLSLKQVADLVGGKIVRGDTAMTFDGLNALKEARPGELSFFGNAKYVNDFHRSEAGGVLVAPGADLGETTMAVVEVENPTWAFGEIVQHFIEVAPPRDAGISPQASIAEGAQVDETATVCAGAVVEEGATVGARSVIGPGSVVGRMARVGSDCLLKSNVAIEERCILGDRVVIESGAVIGSDGFGYELVDGMLQKVDQIGIVELESDVEVGANSTIDRARFGKTLIGQGTKIDNLVQVGHNVVTGKCCILVSQSGIAGSTELGDFVTVAAQAGAAGHLKVGSQVTLTARAGALKDLPDAGVYSGMPARPMKEEMRAQARVQRLDRLIDRVVSLEKKMQTRENGE